jgi:hypothetical protein
MDYITLPKHTLERQDDHPLGGRHYKTEFGWAGSVTTKLQKSKDMTKINEWRAWKGEEQAALILKIAGWRGNSTHSSVENYLLHGTEPKRCLLATPYWNSIKPFLRKIRHTALCEGAVWHPDGFAGSLDHLGYFDEDNGEISLNDWKSADNLIDEEKPAGQQKLYDYKLQVAAYVAAAEFVYSEFNLFIPRARIVVAIPDARCQVVLLQRDELKQLFIHFQARNRYANSSY